VVEPGGFTFSYPDPCEWDLSLMSDEIADDLVCGDYSKAEIKVHKFFDLNENGIRDGCEPPVENEGRRIFLEVARPPCGTCHTLKDAGTAGQVGPNLDQLRPDPEKVVRAVTGGVGAMPAQAEVRVHLALGGENLRPIPDIGRGLQPPHRAAATRISARWQRSA